VECLRVAPPRGSPSGAFAPPPQPQQQSQRQQQSQQQPQQPPQPLVRLEGHISGTPAGSLMTLAPAAAATAAGQMLPPLPAAELSGALWALAVLGGDVHYEKEMEALAALLPLVHLDRLLQVGVLLCFGGFEIGGSGGCLLSACVGGGLQGWPG
jgi:hypothetical protein